MDTVILSTIINAVRDIIIAFIKYLEARRKETK